MKNNSKVSDLIDIDCHYEQKNEEKGSFMKNNSKVSDLIDIDCHYEQKNEKK